MPTIAAPLSLNYIYEEKFIRQSQLQETCMSESKPQPSRRGFMLGAAAAGAATAAVATLPLATETGEAPVTEKKPAPANGGGYHVTEHIKRYYKTTLV